LQGGVSAASVVEAVALAKSGADVTFRVILHTRTLYPVRKSLSPAYPRFWVIWRALDEVAVGFEGVRVASRLVATGRDIWIVFDGGGRRGGSASRAAYSIAVGWFSRQFPEPRKERYAVHEFKLCRQNFLIRGCVLSNGAKSDVVVRNPFDAPSA
jgi:hypothetical protein